MNNVKRLAVYCGSAPGAQPNFADATRATAAAWSAAAWTSSMAAGGSV